MENFAHLVIFFKKKKEQKDYNHFDHCAVLFFAVVPLILYKVTFVIPDSQEAWRMEKTTVAKTSSSYSRER